MSSNIALNAMSRLARQDVVRIRFVVIIVTRGRFVRRVLMSIIINAICDSMRFAPASVALGGWIDE